MFESNEHSIPAWFSSVDRIIFVLSPMSIAELREIVMADAVSRSIPRKITVTSLLLISIIFVEEDPVTKTVDV
jgi:hypothetical protein